MSDTDSFIDEVTEEVRKDRLFGLMRRYGWIAILLVLLLVGGAAFREYRLASQRAQAQATGDAILTALRAEDAGTRVAQLAEIPADGDAGALIAMLIAADDGAAGEEGLARAQLEQIAADPDVSPRLSHLAALKLAMSAGADMSPEERMIALSPLVAPGAPYRLLAEEQMALVEVAQGNKDAAIERLRLIAGDVEVSAGLRQRAQDMIVALGGQNE